MKISTQEVDAIENSIRKSIRLYRIGWVLIVAFVLIASWIKNVSPVDPLIVVIVMWVLLNILFEGAASVCFLVYDKFFGKVRKQ